MQSAHTALERGHTDDTSVLKHSPDVGRHCSVAEIVSAELQSSVAIKKQDRDPWKKSSARVSFLLFFRTHFGEATVLLSCA